MKYPKLSIFLITVIIAYLIFVNKESELIQNILSSLGYLGAFLAGILYAYGFTATIAASIFLILGSQGNIFLIGFLASIGSFIGNIITYFFITHSFKDEIKKLSKEKLIIKIDNLLPKKIRKYILLILSILIIAFPLPNEIGITFLAVSKKLLPHELPYIILYVVETIGIFTILLIGNII